MFSASNHRFGKNIAHATEMGKELHAAVVIGVDPMTMFSCQVQSSDATNDWFVAGGLRGAPVELAKAVSNDLKVPAHAEIVIEFTVDTKTQRMEGPLGEYTGYYTAASPKPVARITAITHRKGAIFQGLLTGKPITENHVLKQILFETSVLRQLQAQFPTIIGPLDQQLGRRADLCRDRHEAALRGRGQARDPRRRGVQPASQVVIVVEPDIDIRNSAEVEWAQAFRVKPREDVFVVDRTATAPLDPYTRRRLLLLRRHRRHAPLRRRVPRSLGGAGMARLRPSGDQQGLGAHVEYPVQHVAPAGDGVGSGAARHHDA